MSTKTLRKRIALVAVVALGAGLVSVAPANAGAPTAADFGTAVTVAADNYGIISVTGKTTEMVTSGQLKIKNLVADIDAGANTDILRLKVASGTGSFINASSAGSGVTAQSASVSSDLQSASFTASNDTNDTGAAGDTYALFRPGSTGKITIQYQSVTGAGVVTVVDTLTVYAVASSTSSVSGVLSVADSYFARTSSGTAATSNTDAVTTPTAAAGTAYIGMDLMDAFGGDLATGAVIVSATNGAKVAYGASPSSTATSTAVAADAGTSDYIAVKQPAPADGVHYVALTTTVTVSYNGTVVGTRTIKFTGTPAKVNVSAVPTAVATSGTGTISFTVTDAEGNQLAGWTPVAGDTTLNTNLSATAFTGSSSATALQTATITAGGTAGASSTTIRVKLDDGSYIVSAPIKTIASGALYTYSIALDKKTYAPGEVVTLTITGKDADGYAVADGVTLGTSAISAVPTGLTAVDGVALAYTATAEGGVWTKKYYASTTVGSYGYSFKSDKATVAVPSALTATFSVTDSSTSMAAVLKSIVSLIASINKQIALLQKALLKK